MKFISWNVNGIRAWKNKEGVLPFLVSESPDFLCLQETKIDQDAVILFTNETKNFANFFDYPYVYWNSATKKGYSGTAIFSRYKPLEVSYGIGHELDNEGRVITLEFPDFFLITVYTPNSKDDLSRLDTRYTSWDPAFLLHLKKCEEKKPVVVCGDFNVAHQPIDIARPDANKTTATKPGSAGFTNQERERFGDFLHFGFLDSFRLLNPEKIQYSWWSYRGMSRERNVGWRIDYFLTSSKFKEKISRADIYDTVTGSDHCPVGLELSI